MVELGLLRILGSDRFIPGNPNPVPFLGSEEELTDRLLESARRIDDRSHLWPE
jgi:hypothetical protein